MLVRHYNGKKYPPELYSDDTLNALVRLRREKQIDGDGNLTLLGRTYALASVLGIRHFDVMTLAFTASRPGTAPRDTFELIAWSFKISFLATLNSFGRLCEINMVRKMSKNVYALSNSGRKKLEKHMVTLREIDEHRDEIFTAITSIK